MAYIPAEELTYQRLKQLDFQKTVCLQSVSALEVHGPHLPLGMDYFMARWMAEESGRRFAQRHPDWTVVQMPHLPVGTDELPAPGSINVRPRALYRVLWDQGRSLVRAGFRFIVLTNGHGGPRHAAAIEYVCQKITRRYGVQMFSPAILALHRIITGQRFARVEELLGRPLTPEEKAGLVGGEHAGGWETAFALAAFPGVVERNWKELGLLRPPAFRPMARLGEALAARWEAHGRDASKLRELLGGLANSIGWLCNARYGYGGPLVTYSGNPSVASVELGHAFREAMVEECLAEIEAVTSGQKDATEVRSIASDHGLIQPRFWERLAWAAAIVLALVWWW